jgi:glycosyltransferase involved in cell wall biosynthesis
MLGYVDNMTDFYNEIDMLVLTSDKEAFGRVLVEAMSFRCPVIAANVGGVFEVVEAGRTGFLVPPNDIEAYAKKIVLLATKSNLKIDMGRAGYERASNEFSVFQYRKRLTDVLKQVDKEHGKHHNCKF